MRICYCETVRAGVCTSVSDLSVRPCLMAKFCPPPPLRGAKVDDIQPDTSHTVRCDSVTQLWSSYHILFIGQQLV